MDLIRDVRRARELNALPHGSAIGDQDPLFLEAYDLVRHAESQAAAAAAVEGEGT